jgi:hypothetical protein
MTTENPAARAILASTARPDVHSTAAGRCMQSSHYFLLNPFISEEVVASYQTYSFFSGIKS